MYDAARRCVEFTELTTVVCVFRNYSTDAAVLTCVASPLQCVTWVSEKCHASISTVVSRALLPNTDLKKKTRRKKDSQSPTGLEPAISRFVGGCLIHWATGTLHTIVDTILTKYTDTGLLATYTYPYHSWPHPHIPICTGTSCIAYSASVGEHTTQNMSG